MYFGTQKCVNKDIPITGIKRFIANKEAITVVCTKKRSTT